MCRRVGFRRSSQNIFETFKNNYYLYCYFFFQTWSVSHLLLASFGLWRHIISRWYQRSRRTSLAREARRAESQFTGVEILRFIAFNWNWQHRHAQMKSHFVPASEFRCGQSYRSENRVWLKLGRNYTFAELVPTLCGQCCVLACCGEP